MTAGALFHALIESLVYVAVDKLDFSTSMIFSGVMDLVVLLSSLGRRFFQCTG